MIVIKVTVSGIWCSSWLQKAASRPVGRVSGIPEGVGAEEGQLAAILDHAADFAHLESVTQLGENTFVP